MTSLSRSNIFPWCLRENFEAPALTSFHTGLLSIFPPPLSHSMRCVRALQKIMAASNASGSSSNESNIVHRRPSSSTPLPPHLLLLAGGVAGTVRWLPPFYCLDVFKKSNAKCLAWGVRQCLGLREEKLPTRGDRRFLSRATCGFDPGFPAKCLHLPGLRNHVGRPAPGGRNPASAPP